MSQLLNFDYIPDPARGRPLYNASIYIGEPDTDPQIEENQKIVTATQQDGTEVNLPQPIRAGSGGVPEYNGSPVRIRLAPPYSIKVLNAYGAQVYYYPNVASDGDGASSNLVLTAEYVSDNSFYVLGNYEQYILAGMEITLKNESVGVTYVTTTVENSSYNGSKTLVTVTDDVVENYIVSAKISAWVSDFLTELNKFIEQSQQAIDEFNQQIAEQEQEFNAQLSAQQDAFDAATIAAINSAGYTIVDGSFEDGATLSNRAEAVWYAGDSGDNFSGQGFYAWNGSYPKTVTAGSTPNDEQGWSYAAGGYSKSTSAILFLGTEINNDITIPANNNGFSYKPEVKAGVAVTVPPGRTWKILGDTE